jgi:periplasmic copper chaperone A
MKRKKNVRKPLFEIVAAALLLAAPAQAATVIVTDGWFRALPANLPSGGYFTVRNAGANTVSLTGADSPACGMLMLHKTEDKGGTMDMMDMPAVPVAGAATVKFAPGGFHLMCMSPTAAMKPGSTVPVTLDFSDGTKMTVTFAVKNAKGQ